MSKTLIIGVNGIAGVGKDTISEMVKLALEQDHSLTVGIFAFAGNLKKAASIIFGVPLSHFYDRNVKEIPIDYWEMSPRQMAQQLGTEACRNGIRDDIWIKSLDASITNSGLDIAFVVDVRFDNEAEYIINRGGIVVQLIRNDSEKIKDSNHQSESGINPEYISREIYNITGNTFIAAGELQNTVLRHLHIMREIVR